MQSWEDIWYQTISSERAKEEYRKAFLLNMFQKMVSKMDTDDVYKSRILTIYRQTSDIQETTKILFEREFQDYYFSDNEIELLSAWMTAHRRKQDVRKSISQNTRRELCEKQQNKCAICGQPFNDSSKIHIDHIIPWVLVGDELENNYQALCDTCNECKSSKTDYMFKSLLKLI